MTFIVLAVIAFLIFLMTRRYRRLLSVIIVSTMILALTTVSLWWGMNQLAHQDIIHVFNAFMDSRSWYALIAAWYAGDTIAIIRILRTYHAYRSLTRPSRHIR